MSAHYAPLGSCDILIVGGESAGIGTAGPHRVDPAPRRRPAVAGA